MRQRAYASEPVDDLAADGRALSRRPRRERAAPASPAVDPRCRSAPPGRDRTGLRPRCASTICMAMCDDTGLFQHAVHSVPDRVAWLLRRRQCPRAAARLRAERSRRVGTARRLDARASPPSSSTPGTPTPRRFRNFMSFDRRWLEDAGLGGQPRPHALGAGRMRRAAMPSPSRRRWADGAVRRGAARRRGASARRAPGPSRCSASTPIARPSAADAGRRVAAQLPGRPADGAAGGRRDAGLGLVRGGPRPMTMRGFARR